MAKAEFKVTYFLWTARKDDQGLAPVYIRSKQNTTAAIPYNTGVRLHPQQWDKKKNEPKNKPARLLELEAQLKATYRDLLKRGMSPTLADLLTHLYDRRRPADLSVVAWCEDYLQAPYSYGMKLAVAALRSNVKKFQPGLTFDRLNKATLRAFFEYLTAQGIANNTQSKRLTSLANVASHANVVVPALESYKLPYGTRDAYKPRLTWEEVSAVMRTEPRNQLEAVSKDLLLLACFSGLRISDILTLRKGQLHEYHYARIQVKSKKPVLVTVHRYNRQYFRKYMTSDIGYVRQRLSDGIKAILERAGTFGGFGPVRQGWAILRAVKPAVSLLKPVTKYKQVGNEYHEVTAPKYKALSYHSGRRFYARLLSDLGLSEEIVRDELGHSFGNVTQLYAGSQDHMLRVARVRHAIEGLEERMRSLASLQA